MAPEGAEEDPTSSDGWETCSDSKSCDEDESVANSVEGNRKLPQPLYCYEPLNILVATFDYYRSRTLTGTNRFRALSRRHLSWNAVATMKLYHTELTTKSPWVAYARRAAAVAVAIC